VKRVRIRRKGTEVPSPARQAEQAARRQLLWAAGAEQFKHRDPVSFVTESFCQTFDASLRRRAISEGEREASYPDPTSTRPFYERQTGERQDMLRRFSETALQRGTLSGAVLRGSGRMMLFSCLKKTVGQSEPVHWQQRKLFEKSAKARNVPGHGSDRVAFNPGFAESAVALVVDALKDARRTVETLMDMANGRGIGGSGAKTLRKMYPFLDDSRERALLKTYRERLKGMDESDPARPILVNAAGRAEALIAKKAQMKQEFVSKLRVLSERANRALAEWEQPAFALELRAALIEAAAEEPPEDGGGKAMEQQRQGKARQQQAKAPRKDRQFRRSRSSEKSAVAAHAAKALLAGAKVSELSSQALFELAGTVGNSAMLALMARGAKSPELAAFALPADAPDTAPFEAGARDCQTANPEGLTATDAQTAAFDAAGLRS